MAFQKNSLRLFSLMNHNFIIQHYCVGNLRALPSETPVAAVIANNHTRLVAI